MRALLTSLGCSLFVSLCSPGLAQSETPPRCIAVVGTNDLHGQIEPESVALGSHSVQRGGLLGFSGYLDIVKKEYKEAVLLLDGGDLLHGSYNANHARGAAMIQALNHLGFHGSAIGNHEFDFGPLTPGASDRVGVLKRRIQEADFPFLGANIIERSTGQVIKWPNTAASFMREVGGYRVGVIGIATPATPQTTRPQNIQSLNFMAPKPVVLQHARELRSRGAQLIVLVSHLGASCEDTSDPNNLESCDNRDELFRLLNDLPHGMVDIALGGHTHSLAAHWINGTATLESGHRGRYFGWIQACPNPEGGLDRVHSVIHRPVPTCLNTWADGTCGPVDHATEIVGAQYRGEPIVPSASLAQKLQPFLTNAQLSRDQLLPIDLPHALSHRVQPSDGLTHKPDSLGILVAEAMRVALDADIGIQNRGGVRASLKAGQPSYGEVYKVLPFGNFISTMQFTGAQLTAFVQHFLSRHGHPPYISGLQIQKAGSRWTILHEDHSPIETTRIYRIATNDYLAGGGEGLDKVLRNIPKSSFKSSETLLLNAFIELLQSTYPRLAPPPAPQVVPPKPTSPHTPPASSPG